MIRHLDLGPLLPQRRTSQATPRQPRTRRHLDPFGSVPFNRQMTETDVDLGTVTAPSGMIVLGMAGWIDYWAQVGRPLSERARTAIATGGGHLHGPENSEPSAWTCEAIAVAAAADRPLQVRAQTSASPFDGEPTIAVLEVDLGLLWPGPDDGEPVQLGDLPVDRCGMVLGDAHVLDDFTGLDVIEAIITARKSKGKFTSFQDFLDKVDLPALNKRAIDSLIKAGAFDSLGHTRKGLATVHEMAVDAVVPLKKAAAYGTTCSPAWATPTMAAVTPGSDLR
ncbi:hypothetical protein ACFYZB_44815 [Streptomyces sp. NPDC001852]|uniref:helix-hairpin-helix domain-containing protein n=1 Tax=Streptomyces sp. NPDC001852 TaxID=3364619 RepID=UPI003673B59C